MTENERGGTVIETQEPSLSFEQADQESGEASGGDKKVPWGIAEAIIVLTVCGLIFFGLSVIQAVPMIIEAATGAQLSHLKQVLGIVITIGSYVLFFLVVWSAAIKIRKGSWRDLGARRFKLPTAILQVALLFIAVKLLSTAYAYILSWMGVVPPPDQMEMVLQLFGKGIIGLMIAIFATVIVAPVVEELVFRGFVYPGFRQAVGVKWALVLNGAIFGAIHLSPYLFLPVAFIGFALAWVYERTDSLGPPIILHALNNLIAIGYYYTISGGIGG